MWDSFRGKRKGVVAKEGIEPPTLSGISERWPYRVKASIESLQESKSDVKKM
jgi:hypothetical protein